MVKGKGADSSSLKLNLTDPCRILYSTVPVPLLRDAIGRQAGSTVSVYARVQCPEPKTGQKKVQL